MTAESKADVSDSIMFMLVDDDQILVHSLARALRPLGKVAFSNDFDRVHVSAANARPRIMLIDIDLPLVTGIEIARRIRSNSDLDGTYILMMSAHRSEAVIKQVSCVDVDGLLAKPVDIAGLLTRMRELLDQPRPRH